MPLIRRFRWRTSLTLGLAALLLVIRGWSPSGGAEAFRESVIDAPLPPAEAARTMVVPEGFHVTLFAGEPDVAQPIAFCIDDRGRLWVAEAYSYPRLCTSPRDRILVFTDTDGDG